MYHNYERTIEKIMFNYCHSSFDRCRLMAVFGECTVYHNMKYTFSTESGIVCHPVFFIKY